MNRARCCTSLALSLLIFFYRLGNQLASGWHAYADQEALPSIPETSLSSEIELPELENISICDVAGTTFQKLAMSCSNDSNVKCDFRCAASWASALRDYSVTTGSNCSTLAGRIETFLGISGSNASSRTYDSLKTELLNACQNFNGLDCPCSQFASPDFKSYCSDTSRLLPPNCPSIDGAHVGWYDFPFLTWTVVGHYQRLSRGFLGGLSSIDPEYSSWACLNLPVNTCGPVGIHPDDTACFKYSKVRGEFHFWGYNSDLNLHTPMFQLLASFCDENSSSTLVSANTGLSVPLGDISYTFKIGDDVASCGNIQDLPRLGCGEIELRQNTLYVLEIDAGDRFETYRSWFRTSNVSQQSISAALQPTLATDLPSFGATLSWCAGGPSDLELYLHPQAADEMSAVSTKAVQGPQGFVSMLLQMQAVDFGEGTYSLLVRDGGAPSDQGALQSQCAFLSLSALSCAAGRSVSVYPGQYRGAGTVLGVGWWHAMDIVVAAIGDSYEFSVAIVDELMWPGPDLLRTGAPTGLFLNSTYYKGQQRLFRTSGLDGTCSDTFAELTLRAFDAATLEIIRSAEVLLDFASNAEMNQNSSILELINGRHQIYVSAPLYGEYELNVDIKFGQILAYSEVFLAPLENGSTYIVLRRELTSLNVELYSIPVATRDLNGNTVSWMRGAGPASSSSDVANAKGRQRPYMSRGVNGDSGIPDNICSCSSSAHPGCRIYSKSTPTAQIKSCANDLTNPVCLSTGPLTLAEVHTFSHLEAGYYLIYVKSDLVEKGHYSVDVWIGDGNDAVQLADNLESDETGWVFIGYLEVSYASSCTSPDQGQHGPGLQAVICNAWFALNQISSYPIDNIFVPFVINFLPAVTSGLCGTGNVSYSVLNYGNCNCDQSVLIQNGYLDTVTSDQGNGTCYPQPQKSPAQISVQLWIGLNRNLSFGRNFSLVIAVPGFLDVSHPFSIPIESYDGCSALSVHESVERSVVKLVSSYVIFNVIHSQVQNGEYTFEKNTGHMEDLGNIGFLLYSAGQCTCWNETMGKMVPGKCTCDGSPKLFDPVLFRQGLIDIRDDAYRSEMDLRNFTDPGTLLCSDTYWIYIDSPKFYRQLSKITFKAGQPFLEINVTMVEKVCQFCIRAVLIWGAPSVNPKDLDFHVLNVAGPGNTTGGWKPEGCQNSNEVYWDDQRGPKWGGVTLDVDARDGYGPETITFTGQVTNGQYNLVVNVYTDGGTVTASDTLANDPDRLIVVYIYDGAGLIAVTQLPDEVRAAQASAWWVGTVTKTSQGYTYTEVGLSVQKFDIETTFTRIITFNILSSQIEQGLYDSDEYEQQVLDLEDISISIYNGGVCSCWNDILQRQIPGTCQCTGQLMTSPSLSLGSGSVTVSKDWFRSVISTKDLVLGNMCIGTYWFLLRSQLYYERVQKVTFEENEYVEVNLTMIEKVCQFCIRAVLVWGAPSVNPTDLDFHVLNVTGNTTGGWKPEGCQNSNEVYWDDQRGPKWGGVTLDVDARDGYGPETITFTGQVTNGQYNLVVNVYTDGGTVTASDTLANDPDRLIVVYIYDGAGLIAETQPPDEVRAAQASAWWVGSVEKNSAGFKYFEIGKVVKKFDRCQSQDAPCSLVECATL